MVLCAAGAARFVLLPSLNLLHPSNHLQAMDIHEFVVTRIETDRRQQSMFALFSQTDILLWGIDTSKNMYICEGRLKWDPSRIVTLTKNASSKETAQKDHVREEASRNGDEKLILAIQAALKGDDFSPTIEHWEGDRIFRTRFITERGSFGSGEPTDSNGVVQAALALTYEITDERARSHLQTENERLVIKEKAAIDANYLKSRFLANVRSS